MHSRGFDLDVSAVAEAITSKTKAIILNSPCNPTGAVASAETLSQLAKLAQERDLVVLADEVYKHILFDGRTYNWICHPARNEGAHVGH